MSMTIGKRALQALESWSCEQANDDSLTLPEQHMHRMAAGIAYTFRCQRAQAKQGEG